MRKIIINILLIILAITAFSTIALAADCTGISISSANWVYPGDVLLVNVFAADAKYVGTNMTLGFPSNTTIVTNASAFPGSELSENVTILAVPNSYNWSATSNDVGPKTFTLTINGTVNCTLNLNTKILNPGNPNLTATISDYSNLVIGESVDYQIDITNNGTEPALNMSGNLDLTPGIIISNFIDVSNLNNKTTNNTYSKNYTYTPNHCGAGSVEIVVDEYYNSVGDLGLPVSSIDSFNVVGSDISVTPVVVSSTSVNVGDSVTLTSQVSNLGTQNANVSIEFFVGGVSVGTTNLINVTPGAVALTVSNVFTANVAGNHPVSVVATTTNECNVLDNSNTGLAITVASNSGSSGNGGGSSSGSSSFRLSLDEDTPVANLDAKSGSSIKIVFEGKTYYFRMNYVRSDSISLQLMPGDSSDINVGEFALYDLDKDGVADLRIILVSIDGMVAELRFELTSVVAKENPALALVGEPGEYDREGNNSADVLNNANGDQNDDDSGIGSVAESMINNGIVGITGAFVGASTVSPIVGGSISIIVALLLVSAFVLYRKLKQND